MKPFRFIFLFFSILLSINSNIQGQDIGISFTSDKPANTLVKGNIFLEGSTEIFEAVSSNSLDVIHFVKNQIELGNAGKIKAVLKHYSTQLSETLHFYGHYDDEGNFEAHAIRPNAHVIKWKETSIPPSDEDLTDFN